MSNIVIPGQEPSEEVEELKYKATKADEECFFLMYHLNFQPSEVERLSDDYRKWVIARFIGQKQMEKEMMERSNLARQIMPNLRGE